MAFKPATQPLALPTCAGCGSRERLERTDYNELVCPYCNYCDGCQEVKSNGELVLKANGELTCGGCDD